MRENMGLYRGKAVDSGEWVYGPFATHGTDCMILLWYFDHWNWHTVDPATVGECTGLPDKNRTEIFEGDIVKHDDGRVGYIAFLSQAMSYRLVLPKMDVAIGHRAMGGGYNDASMLEIIGNVHDNPSLLTPSPQKV